jgi:hypothetical protein
VREFREFRLSTTVQMAIYLEEPFCDTANFSAFIEVEAALSNTPRSRAWIRSTFKQR